MMEEWHQKLHNNTSPDDVAICEALVAYIDSGLDISAYWESLAVRQQQPVIGLGLRTNTTSSVKLELENTTILFIQQEQAYKLS